MSGSAQDGEGGVTASDKGFLQLPLVAGVAQRGHFQRVGDSASDVSWAL